MKTKSNKLNLIRSYCLIGKCLFTAAGGIVGFILKGPILAVVFAGISGAFSHWIANQFNKKLVRTRI